MMRHSKGQSLDEHILNALKMDCVASEHPAVVFPCLTTLEKLSNQFYTELKTEVQLVSMFRSTNSGIQNGAKEDILRLKISCSTVARTLDHITQQDNLVIDSSSKNKKQKKNTKSYLEEDVNGGELLRGEKALCFIASLLDVLLLKKDLANSDTSLGHGSGFGPSARTVRR